MSGLTSRNLVVGLRLNGVNKVGELDGVLDEKYRYVIPDDVPVPLLRVEFDSEPSNIADRILRKNTWVNVRKMNTSIHTALPLAPWTVLNRTNTGVVRDESVSTGA